MNEAVFNIAPALRVLISKGGNVNLKYTENGVSGKVLFIKETDDNALADAVNKYLTENGTPDAVSVENVCNFVCTKTTDSGRLAGKVAIVTGGAQGFGKGIAEAMVKEGAYLVIADMNYEGRQCSCHKG